MKWKFWERKPSTPIGTPVEIVHPFAHGTMAPGKIDVYSGTWRGIKDHCENRIQDLRSKNDSPSLNEVQTAVLRGQIIALRDIVSLGDANRKPASKPVEYDDRDLGGLA